MFVGNFNSEIPEEKIIRLMNLIHVPYSMAKQLLRNNNSDVGEAVTSYYSSTSQIRETNILSSIVGKDDILMNFMKEFSGSSSETIVHTSKTTIDSLV